MAKTNVTAQMVKELRDKTGAGMMDCKAALAETEGDMETAVDWLRKKGLAKAAKKAGRIAAEGLIGVAVGGLKGGVVEVNSETDFVARNEQFQGLVRMIANVALGVGRSRQDRRHRGARIGRTEGRTDRARASGGDAYCRIPTSSRRPRRARSCGGGAREKYSRRQVPRSGQAGGDDRQDRRVRAQDFLQGGLPAGAALYS